MRNLAGGAPPLRLLRATLRSFLIVFRWSQHVVVPEGHVWIQVVAAVVVVAVVVVVVVVVRGSRVDSGGQQG